MKSRSAMQHAGFKDEEVDSYNRESDHTAAATDRFPFPDSNNQITSCRFGDGKNAFHHPLEGNGSLLKISCREGELEDENNLQPESFKNDSGSLTSKERFMLHWRFWKKNATEKDWRYNFLPADTRIPDHTIWTHMQMVSALSSGVAWAHRGNEGISIAEKDEQELKVSFLKFQIGPIQDFIAAARSTRDLWSGSYLLSWLMSKGLAKLSDLIGPDSVIFPNLWGQPLIDLHFKQSLWDHLEQQTNVTGKTQTAWEALGYAPEDFQIPNLPNVFLAIVPTDIAQECAKAVEAAINEEWREIARECKDTLSICLKSTHTGNEDLNEMQLRYDKQVAQHLQITWQAFPMPTSIPEAKDLYKAIVPQEKKDDKGTLQRIEHIETLFEQYIPHKDRDERNYTDKNKKTKLENIGLVWSLIYEINATLLDGVRQLRMFSGETDSIGDSSKKSIPNRDNNRDALTGKEEALFGGPDFKQDKLPSDLKHRFKHDDYVGAITFIKRVWDKVYLEKNYGDSILAPSLLGSVERTS